ncbi:crotonyl-CoA carboxylase/reductase [Planomonospora sp. ID91781]|uniref:Crotonyl-CoA reductase n=3 Tax=Planomonospora TaxID=1998 RepID=A0A161LM81_9ACTN|nr:MULTISPECIES: crotonyl-CoA carboxylase/reductase [Planomonospora]MBG0819432.1 crotonyl-CoA carboxylase/reductase [Planomonospora sp. ID91781]GAT70157.1 crotonyl-CoA reductase [Planomonospora sphaerica]GGK70613.1 crotonyl-CoA reductase [Planomonospora parontospora]GII09789.1 crotonyl-CoA reductase [Planomonospora parontospora subsp. parontospora]
MTLAQAVVDGADPEELARLEVPSSFRAAHTRKDQVGVFGRVPHGTDGVDKDITKSVHVGEVPMPELAPDEVLVAVMASAINFNTVWTAMFEPIPTFAFLERFGRTDPRHDRDFHVLGSDASGVVVRMGAAVRHWRIGDRVVVSPAYVDAQDPITHADSMLGEDLRAWGFETNYGGLAEFAVVKATQLLPKPRHLSWEEAACNMLCASTAYRMLVSPRGARMKQGDVVLVWGAAGGLGAYGVQLVRNGGGIPVGVVGSEEKADLLRRLGCEHIVDRSQFEHLDDEKAWRAFGAEIRRQVGEDPHIVFEHTGRDTFGASVYVARRGGSVVTCGSSSGYAHSYDNRHLWMKLKSIVGSHGANYQECHEVNRLLSLGMLQPTLSAVYPLARTGEAARAVQLNRHVGKVGVLGLAPAEDLGIEDHALRERIGEDRIRTFRS